MNKTLIIILLLNIFSCKSEECNCEISNEIALLNDSILSMYNENQYQISKYLNSLDETELNREGNDTYRLIIDGAFGYKKIWKIRVKEDRNTLYISEIDDNFRYAPLIVRFDSLYLSDNEILKIDKIFQDSCFWTMSISEDHIGLDGETWILESNRNPSKCNESGYKFVTRWSPSNTKFNEICESIMLYDTIWTIGNRSEYIYNELQDITVIDTSEFIKATVDYYDIIDFEHSDLHIVNIERIRLEEGYNEIIKVDLAFKIFDSSTFPNERQLYLDREGNLLFYTNAINTEVLNVGPNKKGYLLCTYSSAKGNGGHKLFELEDFSFRNLYDGYKNQELRTYDIHQDLWTYRNGELDVNFVDINKDGFDDIRFSGEVIVVAGVTEGKIWYDKLIHGNGSNVYSVNNPFMSFEIEFDFLYNIKTMNYEVFDSSYYGSNYIENKIYEKVEINSANTAPPTTAE